MAFFAGQHTRFAARLFSRGSATAPWTPGCDVATSPGERFLLFITVTLLPLQDHIPPVAGFSSLFFIFVTLAVYVAINRLRYLDGVWMHPVFLAAYGFIGVSLALEFANPLSSYVDIGRFALMIAGALVVATLCRDRAALQMFLYGYIASALWLGAVIFLTSYGTLSGAMATDFSEGSQIRGQAFSDSSIRGNLNGWAAACALGGIVALAFALPRGSAGRRNLLFAIATYCFTASALAMSRGGIAISILSCATISYSHGLRYGRTLVMVAALGACVLLVVPDVIWSRMVFSMEGEQGKEARAALYKVALNHWPEYITSGVGAGNFVRKWGLENGFALGYGTVFRHDAVMVHNSFLQLTINWGLLGLLAFAAIIWRAYRCIPKRCGSDPLTLSLLGIAVSMVLLLQISHNFYDKIYSLGLGMLVAYQRWLAPGNGGQLEKR